MKGDQPGDLVQVDVLHLRLLAGVTVYHFTAWDGVSRWGVGQLYSRLSSRYAADFLDQLQARCPSPVRAIQIDGGQEFQGEFEQARQSAGIARYVLPPKRPQRNGGVERANGHSEKPAARSDGCVARCSCRPSLDATPSGRLSGVQSGCPAALSIRAPCPRTARDGFSMCPNGIWRYEFYASYPLPTTLREQRPLVQWWEQVHNLLQPHQALKHRTPAEYPRAAGHEVPEVSVSQMY